MRGADAKATFRHWQLSYEQRKLREVLGWVSCQESQEIQISLVDAFREGRGPMEEVRGFRRGIVIHISTEKMSEAGLRATLEEQRLSVAILQPRAELGEIGFIGGKGIREVGVGKGSRSQRLPKKSEASSYFRRDHILSLGLHVVKD